MSIMKARRTLTTVQSPTAVDQFLMSKMPSNPTARQEWCKERLLERSQQVLAQRNTPVFNQMKLPKRRRKRAQNAVWMKTQHSVIEKNTPHRPITSFDAKSNSSIKPKKPCKMQLFIHSSSNTPIVYTTQATATVSSIIKWYKKKNNILSHNICLSTSTGFKLCEALTLEDNGVGNDANIYVNIADIGLKGGADDKGSLQGSKNIDAAECGQTIREWSKEDVRRWTAEVVQLDGKYVEALFEEEVDGETLVLYKKEDLRTDFEIKRGPIMKLERNLKALLGDTKNKDQVDEGRIQLPVNICEWTVEHVENWLTSIRIDEKYVRKLRQEEVDGQVLKELTAERIADLTKEFELPRGPMRKILYNLKRIIRVSDTCTGMETDRQLQQTFQDLTIDTKQAPQTSHGDKKIQELPKGSIDWSTYSKKHNKEQATPSKIRQRAQKYSKLLTEKASLDLKLITDQDVSNYNKTCSLTLLHSKWGKAENLLEKQFCFLVLTPQKELTQNEIELLWAQLQKNCKLLVDMLPVKKKQLFEHKSKSMQSTIVRAEDKQPLSIRNTGVRMCPLMQKDEAVIAAHSMLVVLVDHEMLTSRKHCHIVHLDKEKKIEMLLTFDKNSPFAASYDSRNPGFKLTFSKRKQKDKLHKSFTESSDDSTSPDPDVEVQLSEKIDSAMPPLHIEDISIGSAQVINAAKYQEEKPKHVNLTTFRQFVIKRHSIRM
ncbi:uncharacterized protein [Ptychodera flava]|uniref:uncharacterized protein n=1 Tax=Ptychodera flava TaxID=63121 RepID=UPI003969FAA0